MLRIKSMCFLFIVVEFVVKVAAEDSLIRVLSLEDSMKDEWVESHNHYRRLVSDPEAADMRLMTWDDELEALAKKVVSTCSFDHTLPGGLKTSVFPEAGENLYSGGLYRYSEKPKLDGVTKGWYDEVRYYNYSSRSCDAGEVCGHYTQVVWANTYKVGCAIASCSAVSGGSTPYLVSCNYGPAGNIYKYGVPQAPYTSGNSCSQCAEGDGCIDQLCNNTARDIPFTTTVASTTTTLQESTATSTATPQDLTYAASTTKGATFQYAGTTPNTATSTGSTTSSPSTTGGAAKTIRSANFSNIAFPIILCLLFNFAIA